MNFLLKPYQVWIKKNIIFYAAFADKVSRQILSQPFINYQERFAFKNSSQYFVSFINQEVRFFSYIARNFNLNPNLLKNYEVQLYNQSKQRLIQFNKLHTFINHLNLLLRQFHSAEVDMEKNYATSNLLSSYFYLKQDQEQSIKQCVRKYKQIMDNLQAYPQWQQKFKQEAGITVHLLYADIVNDKKKQKLFAQFDKQSYFN